MSLTQKLLDPAHPVTLFEMVPPPADKPGVLETAIADAAKAAESADAINLPEIHDEKRGAVRAAQFVRRVEPRALGARLRRELKIDVVLNRCVIHEPDPLPWFRQIEEEDDIHCVVLVGGESSQIQYPGPTVIEAAERVAAAGTGVTLGGISIPSRLHEAERVRRKAAAGLSFFTTQVLFDSNDIVWLLQRLNGLESRVFLSFAPVSHPRDLEFLRWLGADVPTDLDRFLLHGRPTENPAAENPAGTTPSYFERSLDLCQRILMDVFDNLPPDPPPVGLNIEHINRRNFAPALQMLKKLGALYTDLVSARSRASLA